MPGGAPGRNKEQEETTMDENEKKAVKRTKKPFDIAKLRNLVREFVPTVCPTADKRWRGATRKFHIVSHEFDTVEERTKSMAWNDQFMARADSINALNGAVLDTRNCLDECAYLVMRHLLREAGYKHTKGGWKKEGGAE